MPNSDSLRSRVEQFAENGTSDSNLKSLLRECVEIRTLEGLVCVQYLYEHMYDGYTFNTEIKSSAASTLLVWKERGLESLIEATKRTPTFKNITIAINLLSCISAEEDLPMLGKVNDPLVGKLISDSIAEWKDMVSHARSYLVDLILWIPEDDDVALYIGNIFQQLFIDKRRAVREVFAAVSKRWLAVSTPILNNFNELIKNRAKDESAFQKFLSEHPQLLDPLAVRVWPQPDLFGFKEPDFIVQRADGTYLVIEIECPGKVLVTNRNHLSAEATYAEHQATDYRRNLLRKYADLRLHLPDFQEPDCLVVIGLERNLNQEQKQVLHDINQDRTRLRIVGFDWLLDRARTVAGNMTQPRVEVLSLRVT